MSVLDAEHSSDHDESYFASFTDLLVGVLFIFIIMLMVFASNFNKTVSEVTGIKNSRDKVLQEIEKSLQSEGVSVSIDLEQGILRLPESVLFGVGQSQLSTDGVASITKLASILKKYLPCLATLKEGDAEEEAFCKSLNLENRDALETVLIEGHTDQTGNRDSNWALSTQRAVAVFQTLTSKEPVLDDGIITRVTTQEGEIREFPVLAISGYEARRPVEPGNPKEEEKRKKNRRIDLRFIMRSPTPKELDQIKGDMNR